MNQILKNAIAISMAIILLVTGLVIPPQKAEAAEDAGPGIVYVDENDTWIGKSLTATKNTAYFHAGKKSLKLKKENAKETAYANNANYYAIQKDGVTTDVTLTWEFWYRSKESDGFIRMDATIYDANKTKLKTLTGNKVMLSRSDNLSEWTRVSTSEVVSKDAAYVTFRIYLLEGYNQVWVDDISANVTGTYQEQVAEFCDFHAVTESGEVAPWESTGGSLSVSGGAGVFTSARKETLSFRTTRLVPGYGYRVQAVYTATEDVTAKITYYNTKKEAIDEDTVSLLATAEESPLYLETTAADAMYAVFSITGSGTITLDDFYIYRDACEGAGENGWKANVVWYPENPAVDALSQPRYFRTTFPIDKEVENMYLQCAADDDTWGFIFYNCTGSKVYAPRIDSKKETGKRTTYIYDLTSRVRQGKNVLAMRAHNVNSVAGLIFEIYIHYKDGTSETILSKDKTVKVSRLENGEENPADWYTLDFDDSDWVRARNLGVPPYCDMQTPAYLYGYAPRFDIHTEELPSEKVTGGKEHTTTISYTEAKKEALAPTEVTGHLYQEDRLLAHVDVKTEFDGGKAYFTYTIPDYLPAGAYTLQIREDGVEIHSGSTDNVLCDIVLSEPDKGIGTGSVEKENGVVRLNINGQKESPVMYLRPHHTAHYYNYEKITDIKDSGITLYGTYNGMLDGRDGNPIWTGPDTIDYEAFDAEIYRTLDLSPNAMLIASIAMDAPQWWAEANPEECLADEDGNIILYHSGSEQVKRVSFASRKYREDASGVVKKLVEHMKKAPYRNRICGVRLIGGRTFEWMQYNSDDEAGTHPEIDYSEAMKSAFREATGYDVPSVSRRSSSIYNTFLDPATQKDVIAYHAYLSQCVSDSLLCYAKTVKEAEPDWLVGAYYGYLWFESSSLGAGGCHTTAEQVLDSPYIDYIASPVNYSERINGYATGYMAMSESVASHGKLYMLEQDNRTLYGHVFGNAGSDNAVGLETTMEGSVNQLTRDMATDLVKGNGFWLFDMEGGWFSDGQITERIRAIKEEYDISLNRDMTTNSEVAVYVGSGFYNQLTDDLLNGRNGSNSYYVISQLYNRQRLELAKMGTSYDTYTVEDLCSDTAKVNWSQYKLHIVLSPVELGQEERTAIETKIKKNGNVILWVYLPGVSDGETVSAANISDVIDMRVELITGKSLHLTADITGEAFGRAGEAYGVDFGYSYQTPYAVVRDESATALATYQDNSSYVAAAMKDCQTYTSVYSGVSNVKAETLRRLCQMAGVHLYTDDKDAVIETNAGYISVYSQTAGKKAITLDGSYDVYDVLRKEKVGRGLSTFTADLQSGETGLYRLDHVHTPRTVVTTKATVSKNGVYTTSCAECNEVLSKTAIPAASRISLSKTSFYANGKTQKVTVSVKDSAGRVIPKTEYTVTGTTSAKNPGTYTVKVAFKSSSKKYAGTKTLIWKIALKGTQIKSVKAGSKKLTIQWTKQTVGTKGYQIRVSTDKNFKKGVRTITINKTKTTSVVVKKLKAKKKYYVRIRTYNGKYYSAWSTPKSAKVKG